MTKHSLFSKVLRCTCKVPTCIQKYNVTVCTYSFPWSYVASKCRQILSIEVSFVFIPVTLKRRVGDTICMNEQYCMSEDQSSSGSVQSTGIQIKLMDLQEKKRVWYLKGVHSNMNSNNIHFIYQPVPPPLPHTGPMRQSLQYNKRNIIYLAHPCINRGRLPRIYVWIAHPHKQHR